MPIEALSTEPDEIRAGDTISWLISVSDYPASSGWTLKYQFTNASAAFGVSSSASGDDHAVSVSAATTDDYTAGVYEVLKYVEKGSGETLERVTLATLTIEILPFLAGSTAATDRRSTARKLLDAIEATLEGNASTEQEELSLDGQQIKTRSITELLEARSRLKLEVQREEQAERIRKGLDTGNRILTRFV